MGLMDEIKDKATAAIATQGLEDKIGGAVNSAADSLKAAAEKLPGGSMLSGLIDKGKAMLDSDGDGEIDLLEKAKGSLGTTK